MSDIYQSAIASKLLILFRFFIADQYEIGYGGISSSIPGSDKTIIENENRNFIQPADADSEDPRHMSDKQIGSSVITGNNTLREWTQYLEMNKTLENPIKGIVERASDWFIFGEC